MSSKPYQISPELEAMIKQAGERGGAEGALELALIANRAVSELHKVARKIAEQKKGTSEWGRWAGLANVSRDAVLRTATCRQTAGQLAQQQQAQNDDGG